MSPFHDHPCFTPTMLVQSKRGPACHGLSDAMKGLPGCEPIRIALGDCAIPERRAKALALLHALPVRTQEAIINAERKILARRRRDDEEVRSQ